MLCHVKQPYYDFHIQEFKSFFDSTHTFMYMNFFHEYGLKKMEDRIIELIDEKNINYIILWQWYTNFVPSLEFIAKLREKTFVILWLFDDDVYMHSHGKYYAQVSDVVVTTDFYGTFLYEQLNIKSIYYMGTYPKSVYRPLNIKKTIDVSFVGAMHKADRKEYIDFLIQNGIKVEYFGHGSENKYISEEDMVHIFNQSKINLNFTKIGFYESIYESNPLIARVRQNKGRPLEIGLTKSFCLTEEAPSIHRIFDVPHELDTFQDKNELLEKIRYYLLNYEEAEKKASLMYEKCLSMYEKDVYFPKIFHEIFSIEKDMGKLNYYNIEKNMNFKIKEKVFYLQTFLIYFKKKKFKLSLEMLKFFFKNANFYLIVMSIIELNTKYKLGIAK